MMTRLIYLPDETTLVQLDIDMTPAELTAAIQSGFRPVALLKNAPPGKLMAFPVNQSVVVAPSSHLRNTKNHLEKPELTRRQSQILALSSRGFRSHEIATMLGISRRSVNYHLQNIRGRIRGLPETI